MLASPKLGIKLQAMILALPGLLLVIINWGWYGPSILLLFTLWQFSLGGGLTFKMGK
jgi:hypothetical protein